MGMNRLLIRSPAEVGETITTMRTEVGLTQSQLAALIGTTQSAVSRWERGHDEPRLSSLIEILRACGRQLMLDVDDDVDRAQIRQHLAMTPEQRLEAVVNVAATVASARLS